MIEFKQVSKHFPPGISALSDISFSIGRGELVFLAGPSGAGKSTILKMIAAMERPSSGQVLVNGQDITRLKSASLPYFRRNLGLILQDHALLLDRTVVANVMLPLLISGASRDDALMRATTALEKVNLADKAEAYPLALSGGEQQRVAIARAIVNRPQLILADEPTAYLDRDNATQVMNALQAFQAAGVTCIISSHDEEFLGSASRVIYLNQGKQSQTWQSAAMATSSAA
ncbi:cell division ATP-binding protein FtsE [Solimicrobium silvestre]|uniref:Cell division ATP-binding protein FtsE n=1 Tax=Solimicrobium silvestre TaxID=2099400 RepID=A0A2S9H148_9BURK|nr:ATP-binding cassette domain-containing protein [Solimicrobium silvestre]PRC93687.1 putative ATPase involved in cell division [Solimicrobium silvestre]